MKSVAFTIYSCGLFDWTYSLVIQQSYACINRLNFDFLHFYQELHIDINCPSTKGVQEDCGNDIINDIIHVNNITLKTTEKHEYKKQAFS